MKLPSFTTARTGIQPQNCNTVFQFNNQAQQFHDLLTGGDYMITTEDGLGLTCPIIRDCVSDWMTLTQLDNLASAAHFSRTNGNVCALYNADEINAAEARAALRAAYP
ncbi:hypothetical protein [Chitinophaga vietnamensis]|uniref:hypothetical protein n=1 Tax=Chitinophaga vietnamensis TaxID=2593957 RepID=UPI001177AF76|nr:hypothetical protein [Chitinophaga vietnamensis]